MRHNRSAARGAAGTVTGTGDETKKSKWTSILGGLGSLSPRPSIDMGVEKQKEGEGKKTEKTEKTERGEKIGKTERRRQDREDREDREDRQEKRRQDREE